MKKIILLTALLLMTRFTNGSDGSVQVLNPGDGIRITFYNIPEKISGDYFIQQDGHIQLPYLGMITTSNRDYNDIIVEVVTKYDSLYKNPELSVQPLLRINILGEVKNPGYYVVTDVEKLSGIIALAGGETGDAELDEIYILRNNEVMEIGSEVVYENGEDLRLVSGDRVFVPRRSWLGRNTGLVFSGLAVVVMIISLFVD
jgi:protein involved in polysaccharide export with SLBB domain